MALPVKKLRVVPMDRPWTSLRDRLTGDAIHDRAEILNFCREYGVSFRTAIARMKLFGHSPARVGDA